MPELVCAADAPRWLDERRKGVTATDITAITGLSPYESEYSLYWKKLGHIPDAHEDTPRFALGRYLENYIRELWNERNPDSGPTNWASWDTALYRHDVRIWQMATPDRLVYDLHQDEDQLGPPKAVLEMKSWADADRHAWDDAPPPRVRAQVLWQMDTLDVATGHVGVLFLPSGEFRSYVIDHLGSACFEPGEHRRLCQTCIDQDLLRAAGEEFMRRLRLELPPPSPDASSATLAALKARFADPRKTKEAEIGDDGVWHQYNYAKDQIKFFEQLARQSEATIRERIGEASIITVRGEKVATRQRYTVKAHTRRESTVDKIVRSKGETSAAQD